MQIFQRNILNKYTENIDAEIIEERFKHYSDYFLNPEIQENIHQSKEEQFQEGFLRELFVKILGYTLNPSPNYNLITEKKNEGNSKKADGAMLVNGKVVGVIELKDHKTTDLSQIEAQAFGYKNRNKEAIYVVISNFEKLRFYIDNAVDFEEFDLFHLTKEDFARLWICLAYESIEKNLPKQIKSASLTNEDQITNALYKDYSNFKRDLFDDILKNNPTDDTEHKILLFKKTQKLLDRLLFIFFAEDRGLLPPNSIMLIIDQWEKLKEFDAYQPFYDRLKKYFGYMNTGFQGKNYEVFAYNGGLFKPDEVLDELTISDDVLRNYCKKIADYDFASDVDVNILGHIFENSLTEIEEVTTKLQQGEAPTISKRKKDGVFYTPQYITKYIVENTVGKLCREKKAELGIDDSEYFADKKRQVATKKALIEKLDAYRDWLLQISICDPACGSGAFLNAALNFLIAEHKLIDEMGAKVEGATIVFPNVENSILENNLYGVDINEESVEIAKLSLWLRTAKPHRKLNSLNDNIKCGNSLIDDPAIAGEKAFRWEKEFPQVFREKHKKAWHITTAVHDSRTSNRMVEYEVRRLRDHGTRPYPEPMLLSEKEEIIVTETVSKIVREDELNLLAYNICFDHMHLLLVCEEEEVPKIVGKIKSMTARAVNIAMGRTVPMMETLVGTTAIATAETPVDTTAIATAGHDPLSLPDDELPKKGIPQCSLWTRKFGNTYIDSEEHLYNAIQYIQTNREHHDLPPLPVEYPPCVSIEEAFRPEYAGGFDVVIGNPPYGAEVPKDQLANLIQRFDDWGISKSLCDTYFVFYAKALDEIVKPTGRIGFITPNTWKLIDAAQRFRDKLFNTEHSIYRIAQHLNKVFADATVDCDTMFVQTKTCGTTIAIDFMQGNEIVRNHQISQKRIGEQRFFNLFLTESDYTLKDKLLQGSCLVKDELIIKNGVKPYEKGKGTPPQTAETLKLKPYTSETKIDDSFSPLIGGSYFHRYRLFWDNNYWIKYGEWLAAPREKATFDAEEKLIFRQTSDSIIGSMIGAGYIMRNNTHILLKKDDSTYNLRYVLSCLNSKLINYYYWTLNPEKGEAMAEVKAFHLGLLPIKHISIDQQQPFITLADQMLSLNKQLQQKRQRFLHRLQDNLGVQKVTAALERFDELDFKAFVAELKKQKISLSLAQQDEWEDYFNQYKADCNALSAQIAATDKEIDRMVYELYGLTEDEIKVVEGAN